MSPVAKPTEGPAEHPRGLTALVLLLMLKKTLQNTWHPARHGD